MGALFVSMAALFTACEEPNEPEDPNEVYYKLHTVQIENDEN